MADKKTPLPLPVRPNFAKAKNDFLTKKQQMLIRKVQFHGARHRG